MDDNRAVTSNSYKIAPGKYDVVYIIVAAAAVILLVATFFPNILAQSDIEQQIAISSLQHSLDSCTVKMVSLEQASNLTRFYCQNAEARINRVADNTKILIVSALFFSAVLNAALVYALLKTKFQKKEKEKPKDEEAKIA